MNFCPLYFVPRGFPLYTIIMPLPLCFPGRFPFFSRYNVRASAYYFPFVCYCCCFPREFPAKRPPVMPFEPSPRRLPLNQPSQPYNRDPPHRRVSARVEPRCGSLQHPRSARRRRSCCARIEELDGNVYSFIINFAIYLHAAIAIDPDFVCNVRARIVNKRIT
ncbi:unnamed protein product [Aphis gossypii]|uniref:Uncharacterized protein n=1 Tax=Aphis gossypii TaxID=80765 RepID=A0A9P0J3B4_APHGO|nr:unnamed protein product [Aphis gossypii]